MLSWINKIHMAKIHSNRFLDHFNEVLKDFSTLGVLTIDSQSIKLLLRNMLGWLAFYWSENERIIFNENLVFLGLNLFSTPVSTFYFSLKTSRKFATRFRISITFSRRNQDTLFRRSKLMISLQKRKSLIKNAFDKGHDILSIIDHVRTASCIEIFLFKEAILEKHARAALSTRKAILDEMANHVALQICYFGNIVQAQQKSSSFKQMFVITIMKHKITIQHCVICTLK